MANVRDILINLIGRESVSGASKKAEKGLGDLGDEMHDTAKAAKILDAQIEHVQESLKRLAAQSATVGGGPDLRKQIREQERALRDLSKRRKLVDLPGDDAAEKFSAQFVGRLGPLLASAPLGPVGVAVGAAIGVPAAAMVGSAIGAAVVGGVGVGGVIGGLAVASKDSRVQAAGKSLADTVTSDLQHSGTRFVGPAIAGIGEIRSAWSAVSNDVDSVFAASAKYVQPLARGVAGFAREVGPALATAAKAAGPIVRELSAGLPRIGKAVADVVTDLSGEAQSGATAVRGFVMAIDGGIRGVGTFIKAMSDLWEIMVKAGAAGTAFADNVTWDKIPLIGGKIKDSRDKMAELKQGLEETGEAGEGSLTSLYDEFIKAADGADTAKVKVELLSAAIDRMSGENLTARQAVRNLEEAYDAASEAVKENGKTLDEGTAKGRANAAALDKIVIEAKAARDAIIAQKGSQGEANAVMEKARANFISTAVAMDMSKTEAKKLADQLFGIPNVKRKVEADTKTARDQVSAYKKWLRSQNLNKTSTITVRQIKESQSARGGNKEFAHGGPITGPGPKGVDSVDIVAAPGEHVWTAREVDAAGGHAAVERLRRSVLSGGRASVPAVGPAASGVAMVAPSPVVLEIRSGGSRMDDLLVEILRKAITVRGGNVQLVLGRS